MIAIATTTTIHGREPEGGEEEIAVVGPVEFKRKRMFTTSMRRVEVPAAGVREAYSLYLSLSFVFLAQKA